MSSFSRGDLDSERAEGTSLAYAAIVYNLFSMMHTFYHAPPKTFQIFRKSMPLHHSGGEIVQKIIQGSSKEF